MLRHVFESKGGARVDLEATNALDVASWPSRHPLYATIVSVNDRQYFDNLVKADVEPLFGVTTEFSGM